MPSRQQVSLRLEIICRGTSMGHERATSDGATHKLTTSPRDDQTMYSAQHADVGSFETRLVGVT